MKLSQLIQNQRRMRWLGTHGHGVKGQVHKGMTLISPQPLYRFFIKLSPLVQNQNRVNWLGTPGHGVKGQGHMGTTFKILWARYHLNPLTDFHETFTIDSVLKEDELIRYSRSLGQRSRSYGINLEILMGAISPEPLSWNFHHCFSIEGGWAE